jgi:ferredoxin-type protein NapH
VAVRVPERGPAAARQTKRRAFQAAFFALFLLAPALDLLRFDLLETQLWFLGQRWTLGIDAFVRGEATAAQTAVSIMLRGFLPAIVAIAAFIGVAWRYGRLYCGWLCPHFSAVELLNDLLHRACGRFSVWERGTTPRAGRTPQRRWWPLFALSCVTMGFLWAVTLLTYLLPPAQIWSNLVQGTLTPNQFRFIAIASTVFTLEFAFARHLFCRFGCAAGLFQSLAWMANPKAMVVAFARERARDCKTCDVPRGSACDAVCPMRLHPRNIKRMMFSCVQCGQCLEACEDQQAKPLLEWNVGLDAVRETLRQRKAELQAELKDDAKARAVSAGAH